MCFPNPTGTTGNASGWYCPYCNAFIAYGTYHICSGNPSEHTRYVPMPYQITYNFGDQEYLRRIAKALEGIRAVLEEAHK